ncbi:hypothetical protein CK621_05670 [Vandammella animalimorsus]|uniref:Uncharacterized protein n=2 Tax=Vandammella animalimorsus TaxID=2029117 RepID=A0A2A2AZ28_9BURK|nr:hypothetical protein CK621_05670 [Vandammella animalimorsus]
MDLRQLPLDPAIAVKVPTGLTQTPQTHATLPPVENLYTPAQGFFQSRLGMAVEGATAPANSFGQKVVNGLLGLAVAPMAMAESVVTSLYNAPNNAHLTGQYLARASLTEDRHEATTDVLRAVAHGAEGFAGMGGVLAPASAARTAPGLTPAAPVVRPSVAQTADALADATISVNPARGNPAAIVRGLGELNRRQAAALDALPAEGAKAIVHQSFGLRDLAALTAATGDEFAMFSTGGRRLLVRGNKTSVPITPDMARDLAQNGWRWSAHTHPGTSTNVLRSSPGDRAVLGAMREASEGSRFIRARGARQAEEIGGTNRISIIVNSNGDDIKFTPEGDVLTGWKPW